MLILYFDLIDNDEDKEKFEKVYYEYKKRMLYIANSILHDQYEAEDAVHNSLIGIAKNIHKIDDVKSKDAFSYCMKAAYNAAFNLLPKNKQRNEMYDIDTIENLSDEGFIEAIDIHESYSKVVDAIEAMDSAYRDVLYLHYVKDLTAKEIAKLLGRKSGTVTQQIVRGKKILLAILEKEKLCNAGINE